MLRDFFAKIRQYTRFKSGISPNADFDVDAHSLDTNMASELLALDETELGALFYGNKGQVVHKWIHYPEIYETYLGKYQGSDFRMLEIGVYKGGSLDLWRRYFGANATIFGIDINSDCANFANAPNQVRIGSQADPVFLEKTIEEMGVPDVILDDGSHVAEHQLASFRYLWPQLKPGGLYIIEDLHTSYWPGSYQGGYRRAGTAIELAKTLVDDMHGWYHRTGSKLVDRTEVAGIHFHDSIVIIEKGLIKPPRHIKIGTGAEELRYKY